MAGLADFNGRESLSDKAIYSNEELLVSPLSSGVCGYLNLYCVCVCTCARGCVGCL